MNKILKEMKSRLLLPFLMLVTIWVVGIVGYMIIGWGKWSLIDCAFMTAITLSGVGYGDILGVEGNFIAMIFTMAIIVAGLGIVLYCLSTITAFVVESGINMLFKERKMLKRISKLHDHFIIAGAGSTGQHVVHEMYDTGASFVVVEANSEIVEELEDKYKGIHYILGDATDDDKLIDAGIERAKGIVACLSNDKDNLYITVSAKNLNPKLTVVARAVAIEMREKLTKVGADYVVSPSQIGGMRMASEILRPHVVTFLDTMLRGKDPSTRIGEVSIESGSRLDGKKLRDSQIMEETGLLIMAVLPSKNSEYLYNPTADYKLGSGHVVIVIGNLESIKKLKTMARP